MLTCQQVHDREISCCKTQTVSLHTGVWVFDHEYVVCISDIFCAGRIHNKTKYMYVSQQKFILRAQTPECLSISCSIKPKMEKFYPLYIYKYTRSRSIKPKMEKFYPVCI